MLRIDAEENEAPRTSSPDVSRVLRSGELREAHAVFWRAFRRCGVGRVRRLHGVDDRGWTRSGGVRRPHTHYLVKRLAWPSESLRREPQATGHVDAASSQLRRVLDGHGVEEARRSVDRAGARAATCGRCRWLPRATPSEVGAGSAEGVEGAAAPDVARLFRRSEWQLRERARAYLRNKRSAALTGTGRVDDLEGLCWLNRRMPSRG